MTEHNSRDQASKGRMVAIVIASTMVLWLMAQALGSHFQWSARFAFLFDMAAIAAFIWALYVAYQLWRDRQKDQG